MQQTWTETYSRILIDFVTVPMGDDLCVVIRGGEVPHLGAVTVARAGGQVEGTLQAARYSEEEQDSIARGVAARLSERLHCNVVVCCGVHADAITSDESEFIRMAAERFCSSYRNEW